MSGFVNYVLTLGQQQAPKFGYAGLGLSLEQYGVNSVKADVPGAVAPTAAEQAAYACGDLTPAEVAAGQTTPTCGVVCSTCTSSSVAGANAGHAGSSALASKTSGGTSGSTDGASGSGGGSGGSGSGAGASAAVSLGGSNPLAFTGSDPIPLVVLGTLLLVAGWTVRRLLVRRRPRTEL
jgi:hypothetical protein